MVYNLLDFTGASMQRHPRRRKMRHRYPWGDKDWKLGDKVYLFVKPVN